MRSVLENDFTDNKNKQIYRNQMQKDIKYFHHELFLFDL